MTRKDSVSPSELRFDPVSRDWVVIATGRARRPEAFVQDKKADWSSSQNDCPFESLKQETPTLRLGSENDWSVLVVPNKYPAFSSAGTLLTRIVGPYEVTDGIGFHEVIVTRDHAADIPQFSLNQVEDLVSAYQLRYEALKDNAFVNYISIFKNKGKEAGASIAHPHSQLIAVPVCDPHIQRSLAGSKEYYLREKQCVHCVMIAWDRNEGSRIVFENEGYVVLCPFASRVAFELRVYPKEHASHFEAITAKERTLFAQALQAALQKLSAGLGDPDYNYFIHTAPTDGGDYDHYHWHMEIMPRTSTWAGFELGTGIEISTIEPAHAAAFLRNH